MLGIAFSVSRNGIVKYVLNADQNHRFAISSETRLQWFIWGISARTVAQNILMNFNSNYFKLSDPLASLFQAGSSVWRKTAKLCFMMSLDGPSSLPFEWDWLSRRWHSEVRMARLSCHLFPSVATGSLIEEEKLFMTKGGIVSFTVCVHWEPTTLVWRMWWMSEQLLGVGKEYCLLGLQGAWQGALIWNFQPYCRILIPESCPGMLIILRYALLGPKISGKLSASSVK